MVYDALPPQTVEMAFNNMIRQLAPTHFVPRGTTALFEGFPVALLGFGVALGGILVAVGVYYLITWCSVGSRAWDTQHAPAEYSLRDEVLRDKYGNDVWRAAEWEPNLVEIRRPRWSGVGHSAAIIVAVILVIFSIYAAFQVCGVDPAILVGLGVISLGISWTMADIVVELRDAIRIHSSNILREGDNITSWATRQSGKVSFMGATRFKMEQITKEGDYVIHYMGYHQLLAGGFSRYETGGEKIVYQSRHAVQRLPQKGEDNGGQVNGNNNNNNSSAVQQFSIKPRKSLVPNSPFPQGSAVGKKQK